MEKDETGKPKKPSKRVPRKPKVPKSDTKEIEVPIGDGTEVVKMILRKHFSDLAKETLDPHSVYLERETRQDFERLTLLLSEYLDAYMVLGYRPDGQFMAIRRAPADRDKVLLDRTLQGLAMGSMRFTES